MVLNWQQCHFIWMSEEGEKLRKFLMIVRDPAKWTTQVCEVFVTSAVSYERLFENGDRFERLKGTIASVIGDPELFRKSPEFLLNFALENKIHRRVLLLFIQCFVERVPNGRERARTVIAEFIQRRSVMDMVSQRTPVSFMPSLVASGLVHDASLGEGQLDQTVLAQGALKAIVKRPDLVEKTKKLIQAHFDELPTTDLVTAALSSEPAMKCILSILVPLIVDSGSLKARETLQLIAASGHAGKPGRLVMDALTTRCGLTW